VSTAGPLDGIRIIEVASWMFIPSGGSVLVDWGADVLKVEHPVTGDPQCGLITSGLLPGGAGGVNFMMEQPNRGKRSVAIDLAGAAGAAQVRELAREADVLLENYKVGQLAKYGLDYASLQAINPGLVYCSVTGYGQEGPLAHKAGYDFAIQAEGGLMSITGEKGGEPQKVGVAVTDIMTGLYATTAILAALHERQATGRGRHLDAALLDVQVAMLANQAANQLIGGRTPTRMGNAHPNIVPYQVFATRDGQMVLAVGNDGQFARFCELAGHAEIAQDPRFASNQARVANRAELIALITSWTLARDTQQWATQLDAAAVPCAPILDIAQVMEHPHVRERGMRLPAGEGVPPMIAHPVRFDGLRPTADLPPPALGSGEAAWR